MNFLNPFVLFGLAAASIPLLLHLLNLRKQKKVEFSTLKFLKELKKTQIKSLKIKRLLLLILRTLIIVCAVIAFARPTIQSTIPGFESYSNSSIVIAIDNSYSMDYNDEFGSRLKQSKQTANSIINLLKEGDEIAIVEMADLKNEKQYSFTRNLTLAKEQIQKINFSTQASAIYNTLITSNELLKETKNLNKNIYLISDFQQNTINQTKLNELKIDKNIGLVLAQIGNKSKNNAINLSVDSIEIKSKIFQNDKLVELEATIKNNSKSDIKGAIANLYFDDVNVAQRTIDLAANKSKVLSISAIPKGKSAIKARVELEHDALDIDNSRHFAFVIPENPKIAIIDDLNTSFIELALKIRYGSTTNINKFNSSQFGALYLQNYDIVITGNNVLSSNDFDRLITYYNSGGSILIFANESNNETFSSGLEKIGFGVSKLITFSKNETGKFSNVDRLHPIFEGVFTGETSKNKVVESPNIYTANTIENGLKIIDLNGKTLVSEIKKGNSKAIFIGLPASIEWSNFVFTGIFPTILNRSVTYLTTDESLNGNQILSNSLIISKKNINDGNVKIIDPLNNEIFKQVAIMPSNVILNTENFTSPGVYKIYNLQGKLIALYSYNINRNESDLNLIEKEKLIKQIKSNSNIDKNIHYIDDLNNLKSSIYEAKIGTELWKIFVLFAILFALIEMYVAKISKSEME